MDILPFPEFIEGKLLKRYKRFLADIELEDGSIITAHCPNSGRMTSCVGDGWPLWLNPASNPKRKLKYTLECIQAPSGSWIVTNTNWANHLGAWAIEHGKIPALKGYPHLKREVKYGDHSRVDILLESEKGKCWVEIKSVTLLNQKGQNAFPDAPTERGQKHLLELAKMVQQGQRAVMLFLIMREDGKGFRPAEDIDPTYTQLLRQVAGEGVELLAYQARISRQGLNLGKKLKVTL